ncbi:MAG: PID-CTERM protein-sorting domain-containing protein [Bacteroidales bacterium]
MKIIILAILITISTISLIAQPIPPPGSGIPGAGHGLNGNQGNNGAPIDGGLSILLFLGTVYGIKKIHISNTKQLDIK